MKLEFILPKACTANSLFPIVEEKFLSLGEMPEEVKIDFSQLKFIKPCGVVFVDNLMKFLHHNNCKVFVKNHQGSTAALNFLYGAGFFDRWVKNINRACRKSTTLPLQDVTPTDSRNWLENTLGPWLANCYGKDIEQLSELLASIQELFINVADHSGVTNGSVFGQWYPNIDSIELCIADFGVGIPKTIGKVARDLSDSQALELAFREAITSQSTPRNRGVGLHLLQQNIVERFRGTIHVYSRRGGVAIRRAGISARFVIEESNGYCPGTLFKLKLNSGFIPEDIQICEDETWSL
ncbi:hypothetical protein MNBD_ALPHA03-1817 [hydrothermal vent metagenome]|uniref:Histidine kinase/HSP90-like ATPase domain-containing protein n=1 Tax=hydrothermal vent metagenome TaxID=652676 RepID=A0A3B1B304_9ZZZZ